MISVIIPVYNSASIGLDQCLQAMANQTYSDIQVILVDDGSTDDSLSICKEWTTKDSRFSLICQNHQGPAGARNNGLSIAKGEEIAFVDSDDLPELCMLEILHKALIANDAEIAIANYFERGNIQAISSESIISGRSMLEDIFGYNASVSKALYAKLYQKDVLSGLWFSDLRTNEDIDFLFRVYLRVSRIVYVNRLLYHYNYHSSSIMHTQTANDYQNILTCYESMFSRVCVEARELQGRALDALMRKVVSSRYRNRVFKDGNLQNRLDSIQKKLFFDYLFCNNGNIWVKMGIIVSILMPGLYAFVMDYRER